MALRCRIDFEKVLAADDPVGGLKNAVAGQLHIGVPREHLLNELDDQRVEFRTAGRDRDENAVTEIMERMVGWCGPDARI